MQSISHHLTLVNGTFAPNARWVDPESEFTKKILERLSTNLNVRSFRWSGSNSFKQRRKAGLQLAKILRRISIQEARAGRVARHLLIGHSHGGTVCAYASKYCGSVAQIDGILYLSAPFFHLSPSIPFVFIGSFAAAIFFGAVLLFTWMAMSSLLDLPEGVQLIVFASAFYFWTLMLGQFFWRSLYSFSRLLKRYSIDTDQMPPYMVVYSSGDEVSMLMGFASGIEQILDFLISVTFLASRWTWGAGFFIAVILGQFGPWGAFFPFYAIPGYFMIVLAFFLARLLFCIRFGWDGPLVCRNLKCRSEVVPTIGRYVRVAVLSSSNFLHSGSDDGKVASENIVGLDHSSQSNLKELLPLILIWFKEVGIRTIDHD